MPTPPNPDASGAPPPFDAEATKFSAANALNREDLVPRVPFRGWDYADVGNMIHFDSAGSPVLESQQWRNFLSRSIERFKEFFSISTHFGADVGDHDYRQYENLVATHQSELAALQL
jgi:hypothetical protein